jgi:hypothetical protein
MLGVQSPGARLSTQEYNYGRFTVGQLAREARATIGRLGVAPGEMAPDFELPRVQGGTVRLSALRGRPVLMRFVSWT